MYSKILQKTFNHYVETFDKKSLPIQVFAILCHLSEKGETEFNGLGEFLQTIENHYKGFFYELVKLVKDKPDMTEVEFSEFIKANPKFYEKELTQ